MKDSRYNFRLACAACIGGHTSYVQELLNDRTSGSGRDRPKFQYSSLRRIRNTLRTQNRQNYLWETALQPLEKKIACDKRICGVHTTFPLAKCVPEVGIVKEKISCQSRSLASSLNALNPEIQSDLMISRFCRQRGPGHRAETGPAQHPSSPQCAAQHSMDRSGRNSAKELSRDVRGQPTITRNMSRTKSAIAMSLKSVARGESGQN
jgi:hypothetical protein